MRTLISASGVVSIIGLLLVALGVLPLGLRGVAALALVGILWVFAVSIRLAIGLGSALGVDWDQIRRL